MISVSAKLFGPVSTRFCANRLLAPAEFALTEVVQGWTYGLDGLNVGSRVVLQIPPDLGYGAQEQPGIPANSTLYFVVDIVSAK